MTPTSLSRPGWASTLRQSAKMTFEAADRQATSIAQQAWRNWLTEGLVRGPKRQHAMTRVSTGRGARRGRLLQGTR